MACGTPVITANTSSLDEIAGGAAETVDPDDTEALADAHRAAGDATPDRRRELSRARAGARARVLVGAHGAGDARGVSPRRGRRGRASPRRAMRRPVGAAARADAAESGSLDAMSRAGAVVTATSWPSIGSRPTTTRWPTGESSSCCGAADARGVSPLVQPGLPRARDRLRHRPRHGVSRRARACASSPAIRRRRWSAARCAGSRTTASTIAPTVMPCGLQDLPHVSRRARSRAKASTASCRTSARSTAWRISRRSARWPPVTCGPAARDARPDGPHCASKRCTSRAPAAQPRSAARRRAAGAVCAGGRRRRADLLPSRERRARRARRGLHARRRSIGIGVHGAAAVSRAALADACRWSVRRRRAHGSIAPSPRGRRSTVSAITCCCSW